MSPDREALERKYNLDPSRLLREQSGAVDQVLQAIDPATECRARYSSAAWAHGQIRAAVGAAMSLPVRPHLSAQYHACNEPGEATETVPPHDIPPAEHVWRLNTDAYGAPLNRHARDLRHAALAASEEGVFGVHRLRLADHDLGATAHEWALPWPGEARAVARAVMMRTPLTCWWCYWLRWDLVPIGGGSTGQEMVPRAAGSAMMISCGATELLLGTCLECQERFAADVRYNPGALDYVHTGQHSVPAPWSADIDVPRSGMAGLINRTERELEENLWWGEPDVDDFDDDDPRL